MYAYQDSIGNDLHLALVKGDIAPQQPVLVRVHLENPMCDVLASTQGCGWPLRSALQQVAEADEPGIVVVLRYKQDARDIVQWMLRHPEVEKHDEEHPADLRTHGVGAQILMDLNVHKMRLMTAPKRIHGLAGFGLEVVDYVTGEK
jgi:3,4-dihydroxy 2-butanone 4-phosphate synthase/GTP cyclohydrolase II